jgi:hypothetical protein
MRNAAVYYHVDRSARRTDAERRCGVRNADGERKLQPDVHCDRREKPDSDNNGVPDYHRAAH